MLMSMLAGLLAIFWSIAYARAPSETCAVTTQYLQDPPYDNYFYSDCNLDAQVVVTSPLPDSNLSIIGPRMIVAWPAGNSGICAFFQPLNGQNGSLAIKIVNSTCGAPLGPVYRNHTKSHYPAVGVEGVLSFNASTELTLAILGSIRTIRDFTEGPSLLRPIIQDAVRIKTWKRTGVSISRPWLDNITTSHFTLAPYENSYSRIDVRNKSVRFGAGFYKFQAFLNYPQLTQLTPQQVLNNQSQALVQQQASQSISLSFLSYSEKLLAGAWRFLTYFGRDSMISALLLEPVLSAGNSSALEAVIGAVLERINRTDGSVCHEETIGDYATYLNLENNITSTAPGFTYPMIDTDYFLPILMASYFQKSPNRIESLLAVSAGSVDVQNRNLTYGALALINAEKIMNITAPFETNPTIANLIHLKENEVVGQWRDSTYGLANGRIPFDVNCALVPAALRAISTLASMPGVFPSTNISKTSDWSLIALRRAQVWEDQTLPLFEYNVTMVDAETNLYKFTNQSTFYSGPSNSASLTNYSSATFTSDTNVSYSVLIDYALAINSTENPVPIPVQHTDTAFRLFLLNATNQRQMTRFINATANSILRPFPAGLTTPVGMVVANPALSGSDVLIANFTNSAYHGTVVWSWQLALMAKGLERQLARCNDSHDGSSNNDANNVPMSSPLSSSTTPTNSADNTASTTTPATIGGNNLTTPEFCTDDTVYPTVRAAYNTLWDTIEANSALLQSEVWSWTYTKNPSSSSASSSSSSTSTNHSNETVVGENGSDDRYYTQVALGSLPPPPGVSAGTESNVRQLWSLTFLAVRRNEKFR